MGDYNVDDVCTSVYHDGLALHVRLRKEEHMRDNFKTSVFRNIFRLEILLKQGKHTCCIKHS